MAKISEFKAQMVQGGARPNQFRVIVNFPTGIINGTTVAQKLQFLCHASKLPASTIENIPISFRGRPVNFAGERTYAPWNVSIYCDNDFVVRNAFENWAHAIQNTNSTSGTQQPAKYQVDMTVQQLDRMDRVVKQYDFHDVWPSEVGEIALDWSSNGQIETFDVQFQYNFWDSPDIQNGTLDSR